MSGKVYDLVVIGAGSGGLECAWNTAELYKKQVAVIDTATHHGPPTYSALGGTCVNVGCVPKKLFVTGASYRESLKDCQGFGWEIPKHIKGDWKKLVESKNEAVLNINKSYEEMFNDSLTFHQGFGHITSPTSVEVKDASGNVTETLETKHITVATGGWPTSVDMVGSDLTITSNEAFYLPEVPPRVLVVGGGYIAVEFASIFNAYKPENGHVSLAYRGDLFLRGFDIMVREELATQMKANGVNLLFKEDPEKIEKNEDGSKKVTFRSGKVEDYDVIMYATGRHPNVDGLGLDKAGVKQAKNGSVIVDEHYRTNVPNIFALGDVTSRLQLTPVAIREGAAIASTHFGNEPTTTDYENIASAVFAIPHAGVCGLTEDQAASKFPNVAVYQTSFLPLMHQLTGAKHKKSAFKIITDQDTDRVVGVHLVGMETPETIQVISIAMRMGAKLKDFYTTIGVHPTSSEDLCSMKTPAYTFRNGEKVTPPSDS